MFLNAWDLERVQIAAAEDIHRPNLGMAVLTIARLAEWVNANSDGWVYWQPPQRAARKLSDRIYREYLGRYDERSDADLTSRELTSLLSPVRAFCTRLSADHPDLREAVFPNG